MDDVLHEARVLAGLLQGHSGAGGSFATDRSGVVNAYCPPGSRLPVCARVNEVSVRWRTLRGAIAYRKAGRSIGVAGGFGWSSLAYEVDDGKDKQQRYKKANAAIHTILRPE